jgi:phage gpG-like protein
MKSLKVLEQDFEAATRALKKIADNLPRYAGVEMVRMVHSNFLREGYDDGNTFTKWQARSQRTNAAYRSGRGRGQSGGFKGSAVNAKNPLLRQTLALYNSIQYKVMGRSVFLGTSLSLVPYAKIHNEGGTIHIKARRQTFRFNEKGRFATKGKSSYWRRRTIGDHTITMPKRQYMPLPGERPSPKLIKIVKTRYDFEVTRAMRQFKR